MTIGFGERLGSRDDSDGDIIFEEEDIIRPLSGT